jgi:hypothetical protein
MQTMKNYFKIKLDKGDNALSRAIQALLFTYGFKWCGTGAKFFGALDYGYVVVDPAARELYNQHESSTTPCYDPKKDMSKIMELLAPFGKTVSVNLNDTEKATVFCTGISIEGHRNIIFPHSVVEDLRNAIKKSTKSADDFVVVCPENDVVSYIAIQNILFAEGYCWCSDDADKPRLKAYLTHEIFVEVKTKRISVAPAGHTEQKYTLNDLPTVVKQLSGKAYDNVSVKINETYTAKIDGGKIVVGCQVFEISKLDELAEAINTVRKGAVESPTVDASDVDDESKIPKNYIRMGYGGTFKIPFEVFGERGYWRSPGMRNWYYSNNLSWNSGSTIYYAHKDSKIVKLNNK